MKKITIILTSLLAFGVHASNTEPRTDLLTTTLGYDILKQGEKLEKDPTDIKETDLAKFKYVCSNAQFNRNLKHNSKQFQSKVEKLCDLIVSL